MNTNYTKHTIANIINIQKIVTLHYFEFEPLFRSAGEKHPFWEMVYADKGDIEISAGNTAFTLAQGECFFHKPNEFHIHSTNAVTAPNIFIISFVCNSESMKLLGGRQIKLPPHLRGFISNIIKEGKSTFDLPFNDPYLKKLKLLEGGVIGGQQMIRTYLEQLLILLLRHLVGDVGAPGLPARESTAEGLAARLLKKLDESAFQKITVDSLCSEMNYSRAYLSKVFLNSYGCTINAYINRVKINEAKRLIRERRYNFSQISDMLMFANPLYFSRVFKRVSGMSPTEYKNSVKID